ncbi:MAG: hypothetical protein QXS20_01520 [Candidatus Thorarchaeota archaeon]
MSEDTGRPAKRLQEIIDIGSLFRGSATITFVIQIFSIIVIIGSLAFFLLEQFLPTLPDDLKTLLLLVGIMLLLFVFLAAFTFLLNSSRTVSSKIVGPGIRKVRMDSPAVKIVVYVYAALVVFVGITGVYIWYLVHKYYLGPWIAASGSISMVLFGLAVGALFISVLIQVIIAVVGRTATKVVVQVLDKDDSEFVS